MAKKRAGWERMLYYGAAGSTAATGVTANVTDIDFKTAHEFNETTDRGAGTNLPQKTEQIVGIGVEPVCKMIYKDGDTAMAAFVPMSPVKNFSPTYAAVMIASHLMRTGMTKKSETTKSGRSAS